jgi:phospholipid transport system substrate-binding protein
MKLKNIIELAFYLLVRRCYQRAGCLAPALFAGEIGVGGGAPGIPFQPPPDEIFSRSCNRLKEVIVMRRLVIVLAMVLLGTGVASGAADSARLLVIDISNQVTRALKQEPDLADRDPVSMYKLLNRIVVPHFDFDATAKLVLGRTWRDMSPQQQQRFIQEFSTHLVRFYANSLLKFKDQTIDFKPLRAPAAADDVAVHTEVQQEKGPSIAIDYRLHLKGGDWKVYDVSIDGISLVASNRNSYAAEIRKGGIDTLTARLARINRENGG